MKSKLIFFYEIRVKLNQILLFFYSKGALIWDDVTSMELGQYGRILNALDYPLWKMYIWAMLMVQWLRDHLPAQGTRVWSQIQEDATCRGAIKPMLHNHWASEPQLLSPRVTIPEACEPRACARQEKPHQQEARALQPRVVPCSPQLEKALT